MLRINHMGLPLWEALHMEEDSLIGSNQETGEALVHRDWRQARLCPENIHGYRQGSGNF